MDSSDKHSVAFIDEESYKDLQEKHPPESLAEVNSVINPETGDFNWDCPCLGGMANPPCGAFFKEAFTCFSFSTAEPKGIDCVDKFRDMQQCFKQYPDIYSDELKDTAKIDDPLENIDEAKESS
ncbi:Oxidoreductase [Entomophthora muscae]|uniref:Oxidoreductase n=1 Tax=Entomophthora muscae TaxID=34485 RepID=A0ACC2U3Y4_9FUNG|nr:Oxidoreductase [Entomophthora muscae]